ncbi:hypothetical protein AADZ90_010195 [Aestuariibius sp. 2305UL40-4]|uniref:hypothetical protein n=1 Tax=Aestuariibius violaceus TaxID=3234132 RepID=UPI00345E5250
MDALSISFYAIVCGFLGVAIPPRLAPLLRFCLGAGVGVAAPPILTGIRSLFGGY